MFSYCCCSGNCESNASVRLKHRGEGDHRPMAKLAKSEFLSSFPCYEKMWEFLRDFFYRFWKITTTFCGKSNHSKIEGVVHSTGRKTHVAPY